MCRECHQNPCHPSCINAPSQIAFRCDICGLGIYEGETYFDLPDGNKVCGECVKDYSRIAEKEYEDAEF